MIAIWLSFLGVGAAAQDVTVYVFWQEGCPYCSQATATLAQIGEVDPELTLERIELGASLEGDMLYRRTVDMLGIKRPAVPVVVGLILVLLMRFRPQGIFGSREEMALDDR